MGTKGGSRLGGKFGSSVVTCCSRGLTEVQVKMPTRGAVQPCLRLDALLSSAKSATAADPPHPRPGARDLLGSRLQTLPEGSLVPGLAHVPLFETTPKGLPGSRAPEGS